MEILHKVPPIKYGARFTKWRCILYFSILTAFVCIALSNASTNWWIKDWTNDDVFGDEYKGLWKICYDRRGRGFQTSCIERMGDVFLNNIRSSMCLSFLMFAIILGYLIAMQFRADLPLSHIGVALVVSALAALFGIMMFIATQPIPRTHWLWEVRYGWSFNIGWIGLTIAMFAGTVLISIPKYALKTW